jgi:serine/threonine protein kinase
MNIQYGLQHLDIKPHNIFLVGAHAKVGDFGLVAGLTHSASVQQQGLTPLYAAPERLRGTWNRTTDQYSLAIVYQQMLTGQTPYRSSSQQQLAQMHLSNNPDLSSLPAEDRPVINQALAIDPERRFPSCSALVDALIGQNHLPSPVAFLAPGTVIESGLHRRPPMPGSSPPAQAGNKETPRPTPSAVAPSVNRQVDLTRAVPEPAPTAAPVEFLPGYQLVECLEQTALRDVWLVQAPDGRERLAYWLLQPIDPPVELIAHLEQLRHPALVKTEIVVSPTRRLVLLTDVPKETLRDRLESFQIAGAQGIPLEPLLRWLYPIAEALDWLHTEGGTCHLGLTPSHILVQDRDALLRESGLVSLIWQPLKKAAATINPRYAAPETYQVGGGEPASDQYSLALIYAEATTGIHPRRVRGQTRLDLDLLSSNVRPVLARALDEAPTRRFPSCIAFLDALILAGTDSQQIVDLPNVVRVGVLNGTLSLTDETMPSPQELVSEFIQASTESGTRPTVKAGTHRVLADGTWESCYPIEFLPSTLPLKVEGFREQWGGRAIPSADPSTHIIHLIVTMPRTSIFQFKSPEGGIEVVVRLLPDGLHDSRRREAHITLRAIGGNLPEAEKLLQKQGARLIQSLRTYIHPAPEQRADRRHRFVKPINVWVNRGPVWEPLEGESLDISRGGMRFLLAQPLEQDVVYIEFPDRGPLCHLALRGVVRREIQGEDCFEYGVSFE